MNDSDSRPVQWQLPPGVSRGVWEYSRSTTMADDYDNYFRDHPLFEMDGQIIDRFFPHKTNRPMIADFGCGTGRTLVPLVQKGASGLAIDMSTHMLRALQSKVDEQALDICCLRANLVDLSCVASASVDFGLCMFSTLGMIRGIENRQSALEHFYRVLKPGARLVLHVHNYWFHLFDPSGVWWVCRDLVECLIFQKRQLGDKFCDYRGVPRVYLHSFRKRELRRALRHTGFEFVHWQPLSATQAKPLSQPKWLEFIRASGWLVVVAKPMDR